MPYSKITVVQVASQKSTNILVGFGPTIQLQKNVAIISVSQ